uniref:RRM domain-containing protein n=1 Tax=Noctiluca scintillans TaxID=2966 RepID=A0A7S0ZZ91_NOCSC
MSRGPPDITGMVSLKVDCSGTPPDKWHAEELRYMFEKYGDVGDVFIPREKYSERPRGFAFVRFFKERDAREAIKALNGQKFGGSMLTVSKANRSREEARAETAKESRMASRGRSDSRRTRRERTPRRRRPESSCSSSRSPPRRRRHRRRR